MLTEAQELLYFLPFKCSNNLPLSRNEILNVQLAKNKAKTNE